MIDRSTMVTMLTVLNEQRDLPSGSDDHSVFNECNLRANQPLTTLALREHLDYARDKGWIDARRGALGDRRWRITPAGRNALDDIKSGG